MTLFSEIRCTGAPFRDMHVSPAMGSDPMQYPLQSGPSVFGDFAS